MTNVRPNNVHLKGEKISCTHCLSKSHVLLLYKTNLSFFFENDLLHYSANQMIKIKIKQKMKYVELSDRSDQAYDKKHIMK